MFQKSIFVCGTDTGVGKTLISGALCAVLASKGVKVGAFKPLESGCTPTFKRHLHRGDSLFLKKMAGMDESLDQINPYPFEEPLAPAVAAKRKRIKISLKKLSKNFNSLQRKYEVLFVEGAGGLLVPIAGRKTNLDLIKLWKLPVLLVARLGLGTINHTLLTLEHLKRHRVPVIGVVLNQLTRHKTLADETNPQVLHQYDVPLLGIFPFLARKTRHRLIEATNRIHLPEKIFGQRSQILRSQEARFPKKYV